MRQQYMMKWPYAVCVLLVMIIDQCSKVIILHNLSYLERLNIIPHFFDVILVFNPGAAFSFLAGAGGWQKFFFLALAIVICIFLIRGIFRDDFGVVGQWGASLVIGGAFGNVIDRIVYGHVVDFLLFYYQNWFYPAFNIADSCICVGAVLLILDSFYHKKRKI